MTVFIGCVVVSGTRGLLNGLQDEIRSSLTRKMHGDIQIHKKGYQDSIESNPYKILVPYEETILNKIRSVPSVEEIAPRLRIFGMLNHQKSQTTTPVMVVGIDSNTELTVCPRIKQVVRKGQMLDSSKEHFDKNPEDESLDEAKGLEGPAPLTSVKSQNHHQIVITPSLQRGMGAEIGDEMVLLIADKNNMQQAIIAHLVGIMDYAMIGAASKMAWMDFTTLQKTAGIPKQASELVLSIKAGTLADEEKQKVEQVISSDLIAETWLEIGGLFRDVMALQNMVFSIVLFIVFSIVISAIVNTSLMTVMERTREIGTLMALGYRRVHILTLFLTEFAIIGFAGGVSGLVVGSSLIAWLHQKGVPFTVPGQAFSTVLYPRVHLAFLFLVLCLAVLAALVAGIIPAYRASRMRPVQALSAASLIAFLLLSVNSFAKSPQEITKEVESKLAPNNFKATYLFTNHRTDGTTTEYRVTFQSKDIDHVHGYFVKPDREKGREILRVDDQLWTYLPGVGRAVRLADRDSFAGGDFSNADVLRVDWSSQYSSKMLKETTNQWIMELVAKGPNASYAKLRLWVDKNTVQPVQQHFYDSGGTLLKRCLYGQVRKFGSLERPSALRMENVITKQASELKIVEMNFPGQLPANRFMVTSLGK
ncbi:MAG: outer membrane lipoprotein-sorting protein [Deltaproteobacteria bacterium]|nr:outer membrane lipoprotein-sorting protein [Deltaproteobacteria bacterium]